jgi:hypothetical protein
MRSIFGFCSSSVPRWVDLYNAIAISRSAMAPGLSLVRALEMPLAWWAEKAPTPTSPDKSLTSPAADPTPNSTDERASSANASAQHSPPNAQSPAPAQSLLPTFMSPQTVAFQAYPTGSKERGLGGLFPATNPQIYPIYPKPPQKSMIRQAP